VACLFGNYQSIINDQQDACNPQCCNGSTPANCGQELQFDSDVAESTLPRKPRTADESTPVDTTASQL
jgi:hypothetical protein